MPLLKTKTKLGQSTFVGLVIPVAIALLLLPFFGYQIFRAVSIFYYYDVNNLKYRTVGDNGLMTYFNFEKDSLVSASVFNEHANVRRGKIIGTVPILNYNSGDLTRIKGDRINFLGGTTGNSHIELPQNTPNTKNISVSFWIKPSTKFINIKTDQTVMRRGKVFEIVIVGSNHPTDKQVLKVNVFNKSTGRYETVNKYYFGNSLDWKNVAWVYNGDGTGPYYSKLYINGKLENETTLASAKPLNSQPTTEKFTLSDPSNFNNGLRAQFDELKMYDRAINQNRIADNFEGLSCQKFDLDAYSTKCLDFCLQKSESDQERLTCMKQSCRDKQASVMPETDIDFFSIADGYCAHPLRATDSQKRSDINILNNCISTNAPSSNNCLLSLGRDFSIYDRKITEVCDTLNPTNKAKSYLCYLSSKYDTYHLTNSIANCNGIINQETADECAYYLSRSGPVGEAHNERIDYIINLFGYQSTTIPMVSTNSNHLRDILKNIVLTGKCMWGTILGGHQFFRGVSLATLGRLSDPSCQMICSPKGDSLANTPEIGGSCSSLISQNKSINKKYLSDNTQALLAKFMDFKPGDLLNSADALLALDLCDMASVACGDPCTKAGIANCASEECKAEHPICKPCIIVKPTQKAGSNFYSVNVSINGKSEELIGTKDFLEKLIKLLNKLNCKIPDNCHLSRTQQGTDGNHGTGQAADFCCDTATAGEEMLNLIKDNNSESKLDIISECTESEKECAGTSNCECLIHVDSVYKGGSTPEDPCIFKNMNKCENQSTTTSGTCVQEGCAGKPCCTWKCIKQTF